MKLVEFYAKLVRLEKLDIENVPDKYREKVREVCNL